jgi:N-terminal domain of (some) glycogen debranching enzymes
MAIEVTVGPPLITITRGNTFVLAEPDGCITAYTDQGIYSRDTRYVSNYETFANGPGRPAVCSTCCEPSSGSDADAHSHMLYIDPVLPKWLPDITLHNLRVGASTVTLRFWREQGATRYDVLANSNVSMSYIPAKKRSSPEWLGSFSLAGRGEQKPRVRQMVTPLDAPESQPKHAVVLNLPGFSPFPHPFAMTLPYLSIWPAYLC